MELLRHGMELIMQGMVLLVQVMELLLQCTGLLREARSFQCRRGIFHPDSDFKWFSKFSNVLRRAVLQRFTKPLKTLGGGGISVPDKVPKYQIVKPPGRPRTRLGGGQNPSFLPDFVFLVRLSGSGPPWGAPSREIVMDGGIGVRIGDTL